MNKRWLFFGGMILLGTLLGLFFGWGLLRPRLVDTQLSSLRADYKADFVLMVAESYRLDNDINLAVQRLKVLGNQPTLSYLAEAITTARELQYSQNDIALMASLIQAVQSVNESSK